MLQVVLLAVELEMINPINHQNQMMQLLVEQAKIIIYKSAVQNEKSKIQCTTYRLRFRTWRTQITQTATTPSFRSRNC